MQNPIPSDPDTVTYIVIDEEIRDYNVTYEKWSWDGIIGDSIIFNGDDVINLSDDDIKELVMTSSVYKPDSSITVKHSDSGYVFANFNAEMND